jgi:hypothetical protein
MGGWGEKAISLYNKPRANYFVPLLKEYNLIQIKRKRFTSYDEQR